MSGQITRPVPRPRKMHPVTRSGPPVSPAEFWTGIAIVLAFGAWSMTMVAVMTLFANAFGAWAYAVGALLWLAPVLIRRRRLGR